MMQCEVYKRLVQCDVVRLQRENAELRKQIEMANRHKQLFCDEMNVYKKACTVVEKKLEDSEQQLAEVNATITQMRAALKKAQEQEAE
jgi:septal ring factor EnvC (AmiA/AmiB activator)